MKTARQRLCNDHPIKRIAVMHGQAVEFQDIGEAYRKQPEPVYPHLLIDQISQRSSELQLAELDLDLKFPHTRMAQPDLVRAITQFLPDVCWQLGAVLAPLNEGMSVEEVVHASRPSQNSSPRGASKSSATCHLPFPRPGIRGPSVLAVASTKSSLVSQLNNECFSADGKPAAAISISASVLMLAF
ncbi:MAG: hypothetical protein V4662_26400 [Verrucomicrobiota bacterium]